MRLATATTRGGRVLFEPTTTPPTHTQLRDRTKLYCLKNVLHDQSEKTIIAVTAMFAVMEIIQKTVHVVPAMPVTVSNHI